MFVPHSEILFPIREFEGAIPVAVILIHRVLDVGVLENEIGDDFDAALLSGVDEVFESLLPSEARFDFAAGDRPVAMVSGVGPVRREVFPPGIVRIAVQRREPQDIDANFFEVSVLDLLLNALEVAAIVIRLRKDGRVVDRTIIRGIAVHKPVGKRVVDHTILPLEGICRADEGADGTADAALVVCGDDSNPSSVGKAGCWN